mmetsp:Transcript_8940/g.23796  ORF Transcript_8940/g.23796 Transcript_8940/m.23796 type:complete len:263 (-) Transcript_8940:83-871(-)
MAAAGAVDASEAAEKREDPLKDVKAQLDGQMRAPVFNRRSSLYDGEEFAKAVYAELVPWGKDQSFTGLVRATAKGAQTPHGWGVLEHHGGFIQSCQAWRDGVPDGPGAWASCTPGQEQCGYGAWSGGRRDGFFALVKEGGVYLEEYADGELKRRIKWRKDKLHVVCKRCNTLFVPSANTFEFKTCRYHPSQADYQDKFPCCGAKKAFNPRGCMRTVHCEAVLDESGQAGQGDRHAAAAQAQSDAATAAAAALEGAAASVPAA